LYSSKNNNEYNNRKYVSKPNISRPPSSLNSKNNIDLLSKTVHRQNLKPNPLANSVDPKIVQYNSNLMDYNKLLGVSQNDTDKKPRNYSSINNSIKNDIDAFMKTKNNLEKKIMN